MLNALYFFLKVDLYFENVESFRSKENVESTTFKWLTKVSGEVPSCFFVYFTFV
jgi:hypothetical protein